MKSLEVLVQKWKLENVGAFPPYGVAIIRATFLDMGFEPPNDLVRLYSAIGGMEAPDNQLWRLWPLSEVDDRKSEANEFGVLFSDYFLDSWAYRIKPTDRTTSAVYLEHFDARPSFLVAATLEQFFDAFLEDADELLNGPRG